MVRLWDHVLHVKTSKIRDKLSKTAAARDAPTVWGDEDESGSSKEILICTGNGKLERVVAFPTKPKHASLHAAKKAVERSIIANDESSAIWSARNSPAFEIYQDPKDFAYPRLNDQRQYDSAHSRSQYHTSARSGIASTAGSCKHKYENTNSMTLSSRHSMPNRNARTTTHKTNRGPQADPDGTFAQLNRTSGRPALDDTARRPRSSGRVALKTLGTTNDREQYSNLHNTTQGKQSDAYLNIPELSYQNLPYS